MTIVRPFIRTLLLFILPIYACSTEQAKSPQRKPIKISQEVSQTITNSQTSQIKLSGKQETLLYYVKLVEQDQITPTLLRLSFSIKKGKKKIITLNILDEMCDGFYEGTIKHDFTQNRVNFQYFKNPIPWEKEFTLRLNINIKTNEGYQHSFTINDETRTFTTYKKTKFLTMKALEGTAIITPIPKN